MESYLRESPDKIKLPALKTTFEIVAPRPHSRDDRHPSEAPGPRYLFGLFEQARSETGVLRCTPLLGAHWQRLSIYMYFTDQRCTFEVRQARVR